MRKLVSSKPSERITLAHNLSLRLHGGCVALRDDENTSVSRATPES